MNKRELRTAIRDRNGIPDAGDGLAGHTDIDACIAHALADLSAEDRWPRLLTSASLTFSGNAAALPTGWVSSRELLVNGYIAPHVGLNEFLEGSTSYVWTEQGANVVLNPTPSSAPTATLWYYRVEPELTTDTSEPLLPAQWHRALAARASYHLNVRRKDGDRINIDENEWQAGLNNMRVAKRADTGSSKIKSSFRPIQRARWS